MDLMADGVPERTVVELLAGTELAGGVAVDAFISRHTVAPPWTTTDELYTDIRHDLCIWSQYLNLVAISCTGTLEDRIQQWLDSTPSPIFRRIPAGTLHALLLTGEARGLWLRATHGRRKSKADAKTLSGLSLRDALSPTEDSTYAMGAARAVLKPDPEYSALTGVVGLTPRKSKVWFQASQSLADYCWTVWDLLRALAAALAAGLSDDQPFPWLAAEVHDLSSVENAYDLTWSDIDDLPVADRTPEVELAMATLERATVLVHGIPGSPNFTADVGIDGRTGGTIGCTVVKTRSRVQLHVGIRGTPSDLSLVRPVADALKCSQLLTVHYNSGHAVTHESVWSTRFQEHEFPNWEWLNFTGFNVCREKPMTTAPQDVHDRIGSAGEVSLFSWVLREFGANGYLTCDDGTNEVADFVLLGADDHLSLIHVKGAGSPGPARRISASRYEVVASQAAKNLRYLEQSNLLDALRSSPVTRPATWLHGTREADRSGMLEMLKVRPESATTSVIIVQPHVTHAARTNARSPAASRTEASRVRLVETLLNTARGSIVSVGSELRVIGSS